MKLRDEQRTKDLEVRHKQIAQKSRHSDEWLAFHTDHETGKAKLEKRHQRKTTIALQNAGDAFLDDYAKLAVKQEDDRQTFLEREETLFGKGLSILRSIDWTGLLRQERRSVAIKEAFGLLAGRVGSRSEALRRAQQRETIELEKRETEAKRVAVADQNRKHQVRLQGHRQALMLKREDLLFRHQREDSWIATLWQERATQTEARHADRCRETIRGSGRGGRTRSPLHA